MKKKTTKRRISNRKAVTNRRANEDDLQAVSNRLHRLARIRRCRECGCTDLQACQCDGGPCYWVTKFEDGTGICSCCQPPAPAADLVNHPPHYKRGGIECVDVMEAMVTGWSPQTASRLGQAYQYLFRHAHKGNPVRDLEKAQWWIQREIDALKFQAANRSDAHG